MAAGIDHWAVGRSLEALPTPSCLVDADRLEANIARWQHMCESAGVAFRPHVKTHKTVELARLQLDAGASGMACATVGEAEVLAQAGFPDLVVAYPLLVPDACRRLAALAAHGTRVAANADSELGVRRLAAAAVKADVSVGVHLDVDTGFGRGGVDHRDVAELVRLARLVTRLDGLELRGLTTFRGAGYPGAPSPAEAGGDEARTITALAAALRAEEVELETVSAGSTPTGPAVARSAEITEVRAGTYVFNDLMQIGLGAATRDQAALSILASVVSTGTRWATIDAGSKAFGGDARVPAEPGGPEVYAHATDRRAAVARLSEEHGVVEDGKDELALGERVHWYPAHACTCVNLADELYLVRAGTVEQVWAVAARGHPG